MIGRYLIPLGVFVLLGTVLAVGLTLDPRKVPSPLINKNAPMFTLPELHDPSKVLAIEALRGQVAVLNVWASWCVACREEHALLLTLAQTHDVPLYGLNYKDTRKDALRWLEYYGDPYRVSASDIDGRAGIDYGVYGVPETFVIDQLGLIRYKHIGPMTETEWEETLQPLLLRLGVGPST